MWPRAHSSRSPSRAEAPTRPQTVSADLERAKEQLRRELDRRRRAVTPEVSRRAGRAVLGHLEACPAFRAAARVALYSAQPDELPTRPCYEALRERGVEALFPRTQPGGLAFHSVRHWEELSPGRYGVLEPPEAAPLRPLEETDLVLVPGLAFDAQGNRLGRGGGHYDAALPSGNRGPRIIGLAFAFQLVATVPHGSRDRRVDAIVTESGMLWCTNT
jgi:5-formyltetrahydrofolate cyclo-ligase